MKASYALAEAKAIRTGIAFYLVRTLYYHWTGDSVSAHACLAKGLAMLARR